MDLRSMFSDEPNPKNFAPGDVIFAQGKRGDTMYIILQGQVDIQVNGLSLTRAISGETIGEMALVEDDPRSATAVALTHCKVVEVDTQRFMALVRQNPEFSLEVMRMMANRLRCLDAKVVPAPSPENPRA